MLSKRKLPVFVAYKVLCDPGVDACKFTECNKVKTKFNKMAAM